MATLASRDTSGGFVPRSGETELTARRTRTGKTFATGNPGQYRFCAGLGPIHYRSDPFAAKEAYKEISLDLAPTADKAWGYACETNGYQVRVWNEWAPGVAYAAQFRRAGLWLAMAPVALLYRNTKGEEQVIGKPQAGIHPVVDNEANTITWPDCFGAGLDFRYTLRPDRFFKQVVVRDQAALPKPTIDATGLSLTVVMSLVWDAQAQGLSAATDLTATDADAKTAPDESLADLAHLAFTDELSREVFVAKQPLAWDSSDTGVWPALKWELRREGSRVYVIIQTPVSLLEKAIYPVYIDAAIAEHQIEAYQDDAATNSAYSEFGDGTMYQSIQFGQQRTGPKPPYTYHNYGGWWRWLTVPIPAGSTIDSAVVSFKAYSSLSGATCNAKLAWNDVDSAAQITTYAAWTGLAVTAFVNWDAIAAWTAGTWYDSPDLASNLQTVIDRVGWASDNNLALVNQNNVSSDNAYRTCYQYYNGGAAADSAKLNVTYTEGGGGAVIRPDTQFYAWQYGG